MTKIFQAFGLPYIKNHNSESISESAATGAKKSRWRKVFSSKPESLQKTENQRKILGYTPVGLFIGAKRIRNAGKLEGSDKKSEQIRGTAEILSVAGFGAALFLIDISVSGARAASKAMKKRKEEKDLKKEEAVTEPKPEAIKADGKEKKEIAKNPTKEPKKKEAKPETTEKKGTSFLPKKLKEKKAKADSPVEKKEEARPSLEKVEDPTLPPKAVEPLPKPDERKADEPLDKNTAKKEPSAESHESRSKSKSGANQKPDQKNPSKSEPSAESRESRSQSKSGANQKPDQKNPSQSASRSNSQATSESSSESESGSSTASASASCSQVESGSQSEEPAVNPLPPIPQEPISQVKIESADESEDSILIDALLNPPTASDEPLQLTLKEPIAKSESEDDVPDLVPMDALNTPTADEATLQPSPKQPIAKPEQALNAPAEKIPAFAQMFQQNNDESQSD